jgi:hypothetical protein
MVAGTELKGVVTAVDAAMDAHKAVSNATAANTIAQMGGMTLNGARAVKGHHDPKSRAAEHELRTELKNYEPTVVDKGLGIAGTATNVLGMVPFFGLGALNLTGKGIGWVGKKTGFGAMERAGATIRKPATYFNGDTVVENGVSRDIPGATMGDIGDKLGVSKPLGRASQAVADGSAWIAEKTGLQRFIGNGRSAKHYGKAQQHFLDTKKHLETIDLAHVPDEFRPHVEQLKNTVGGATHIGDIHAHFEPGLVELSKHAESEMARQGMAGISKAAMPLTEAIAGTEAALQAMKKGSAPKEAISAMKGISKSAGKMGDALASSKNWANVGGFIKSVPQKLKSANAAHVMMNAGFVGVSLVSMASDTRSGTLENRMINELRDDLAKEGITHSSLVSHERRALAGKYALKGAADVANIAINVAQAVNHKFSMAKAIVGFLGAEAVSHVADAFVASDVAKAYVGFKQAYLAAHAGGQKLEAEQYAEFLGAVSPELVKRGGARSAFTQKLAEYYAQHDVKAIDIMKELDDGKLMWRVHNLMEQAPAATAAAMQPAISHAAQVRGTADVKNRHREVMGEHTGRVVADANVVGSSMVRS